MNEKHSTILNFKQVQQLLGVSKSYLYKKTSQGKIPFYKPTNGKLFFKRDEVLKWLNNDFK